MKSLSAIVFLVMFTAYAQKVRCQNTKSTIENTMSSIDSFIKKKMIESGMVGLGAAIIVNKKLVWTKGYGYADKDNKIP